MEIDSRYWPEVFYSFHYNAISPRDFEFDKFSSHFIVLLKHKSGVRVDRTYYKKKNKKNNVYNNEITVSFKYLSAAL